VEEPIRVLKVFGASIVRIRPRLPAEGGPAINPAILATDLVDYLVERKVSFREAHGIVGEAVAWAESKKRALDTLTLRNGGSSRRRSTPPWPRCLIRAAPSNANAPRARPTRTWSAARSSGPKAFFNRAGAASSPGGIFRSAGRSA